MRQANIRRTTLPIAIALIVAGVGLLALLILNYGPWNRPHAESAEDSRSATTEAAADAVGAMVTPTEPKLTMEAKPPGPAPVQPANSAPG